MSFSGESVGQQLAALEALLFVAAEPVGQLELQKVLGIEPGWFQELIEMLNLDFVDQGRGLRIYSHEGNYQLVTAPEVAAYVERFMGWQGSGKLSAAALETLTIIAYRQPITRQAVEAIRGVDSSGVVNTLQARGLIEEVGRQDTIGHPVLFGTTLEFLHSFGLGSLKELPPLKELEDQKEPPPPGPIKL